MKRTSIHRAATVLVAALALAQSTHATLIHRYSFNETSGTTVDDSVGNADGVIKGNGAAFDGAGRLTLPGGGLSTDAADVIAGYVDLPNHIINVLTNASFEAWVTWGGASGGAWQRIFDFGTSDGGEDISNGNGNYLFLCPAVGGASAGNFRFAVRDPATGTEPVQLNAATPLPTDEEVLLTVVYDAQNNASRLYSNGVLVAAGPASVPLSTINDVNNWLGRSQWPDGMFVGSYNEFRIYDTALNPLEVAASFASGPENPSTDPASLGGIQAVNLTAPLTTMTVGDTQDTSATADFVRLTGVSLAGVSGVTYQSDSTSVATVSPTGRITAVGAGTANISVSYLGQTDSVAITVKTLDTGVVVAGELFVDLLASDTSSGTGTWPNRAGTGDFFADGTSTPTYVANVLNTGVGGVQFDGAAAYVGPVTTAELTGASDRSIEVWVLNPAIAGEETLVAWSRRGGPDGSNISFNYGANAAYGAVGHWGAPDLGWNGAPAAGVWHYLVYTWDGVGTTRVYADGKLKNSETLTTPLNTHPDLPVRIAAQANTDGSATEFGQALSGYIARVRVHTGLLTEAAVRNNFLYGVELTPPGELQGISLTMSKPNLVGIRDTATLTVRADYANRDYLVVTGSSTFTSSDTNVITVSADGVLVARSIGTATITAAYEGKEASVTLQVAPLGAPKLVHRYSFSEAVGATTVDDSVGNADGVIKGNGATFSGNGQLTLPGGGASTDPPETIAGYVDLPNHIINVLVDATFETWVTWDGAGGGAWQRIFDFGTSDGGEDVSNGNGNYLFLCPAVGGASTGNFRFAVRDPVAAAELVQLNAPTILPTGQPVHLAVVYDYQNNASRLYSNAVVVASGTAATPLSSINDVNNWLGRSQWPDGMFSGTYDEFRIWDGALSAEQLAANYAAGPNAIPEPTERPELTVSRSGTSVTIGWPTSATGFVLESSTSVGAGASWTAVDTSGAVDQGGQRRLTVTAEGTSRYYRLRK
ncbi:MAG: Ig-like domain-containing protein [Bryobacteraceae bacterium]|nr:Ig-like domain-containing protein [Bryobacteraceae bacterium]